jgi:SAM-dependent MidA family methyltransferase
MLTELEHRLIERIKREGQMTFRDFMHAALYDSEFGYYNTQRLKLGPEGDYYTSSNVHSAFGASLARAFVELWVGSIEPLTIIEMGAGTGQLALDVLSAIRDEYPETFEQLEYVIVETSAAMRKHQKDRLAAFVDRVQWREIAGLEQTPIVGISFSNEFVDAMPVHRVRSRGGAIEEQYVTTVSGAEPTALVLVWDRPSTKSLGQYLKRATVTPREGQIIEINLDVMDWLSRSARALKDGFLITIDYGDLAELLYAPDRLRGTLRSFHRHRLIDSPLQRVGEQDITASVNFTALIEYGRDFGFEVVTYERQAAFLTRMGLVDRLVAAYPASDSLDDLKDRLAVKNLFVPGGVSDNFRVLIQRKLPNG